MILVSGCNGGSGDHNDRPDAQRPSDASVAVDAKIDGPVDAAGTSASRTTLVFAAALDGQTAPDIYTIEPDGTHLTRITTSDAGELYPSWSPDHSKIAFVRDFELFVTSFDGSGELLVAQHAGRQRKTNDIVYSTTLAPAAWSPDGTQLVYPYPRPERIIDNVDESNATTIHFVNVDGTNDRELANASPWTLSSIAWAPSGTLISFSEADDCPDCAGGQWSAVQNVDGTNHRQLPNSGPSKQIDWSVDGSRWVYVKNSNYASYDDPGSIFTSAAFATTGTQLVATGAWSPRWSPDGASIAYLMADGIHIIASGGGTARLLVTATAVRGVDW